MWCFGRSPGSVTGGGAVSDLGRVVEVRGSVARLSAHSGQVQGDLVHIDRAGRAYVASLHRDHADVVWLDRRPGIGAAATAVGPLEVGVPSPPVGRVDALGRPDAADRVPLWPRGRSPREPWAARRLDLGPLVYDLQRRLRTGCTLAFQVGEPFRTWLLRYQAMRGRAVVVAVPGPGDAASSAWPDALVVGGSTPAQAALAPLGAAAIADRLARSGRDVVLIVTDVRSWRRRAEALGVLPSWPTLRAGVFGRAWSGPTGSLSVWAMGDVRPDSALFDSVLPCDCLLTGRPTIWTSFVTPVFRFDPMRDLGACVWRAAQPPPRGNRMRELLRWRGPEDPLVALAAFVALAYQEDADPALWEPLVARLRETPDLARVVAPHGTLTQVGQEWLAAVVRELS